MQIIKQSRPPEELQDYDAVAVADGVDESVPDLPVLSVEDVQRVVPENTRHSVTPSLVDKLNLLSADPFSAETIRENFITYARVLQEGKFRLEDYLNAIKYVTYKGMGYNNEESWSRTFPDRYNLLVSKQKSKKDISAHVASYHKNRLVNMIMEQALIPFWLVNQDIRQQALNTQVTLMMTAQSELVRMQAANSVLTHLEKPKENHFSINIGQGESSAVKAMQDMLVNLAKKQHEMIQKSEMKTVDVAASSLVAENEDD